jgi:hypothetical protein
MFTQGDACEFVCARACVCVDMFQSFLPTLTFQGVGKYIKVAFKA